MARRKKIKNNSTVQVIIGIIVFIFIVIMGNNHDLDLLESLKQATEVDSLENVENVDNTTQEPTSSVTGNLIIDYIDVGQGDSILIRQGDATMLIDGGTSECKEELLSFLQTENVDRFEYIVGTHPHEDHIGSLDDVINSYDFDTILFPKVTSTTKTFENLVLAVQNKNKKFTTPVVGTEYTLGEAKFEILAPNNSKYTSTNDYSIVIKLTYGENTFIFTGDAESLSETEILDNNIDVSADVLKVGHHGSTTSTSKKFLEAVSPKYAVISVGQDNSYKHPTKTTMNKLEDMNIPVYRTDEQGTIECISDGVNITFNVEPGTYNYMQP